MPPLTGCSLYQNKAMEFKSKWNCFLQGCVYLSIDLIILSQKTFRSKPKHFCVCKSAIKVLYVLLIIEICNCKSVSVQHPSTHLSVGYGSKGSFDQAMNEQFWEVWNTRNENNNLESQVKLCFYSLRQNPNQQNSCCKYNMVKTK